jgi:DNA-binding beta-propeller fold protein YncE
MDRRSFLLAAAAAPLALRAGPSLVYATADLESQVVVVDLSTGAVRHRIRTRPDPRSVERVGDVAVVTHTAAGAVTVLDGLTVRHVLDGFEEPRYIAGSLDGRYAFVSDSGRADLATIDVLRGEVVGRVKLRLWPRHLSLSRDGKTLWIGLGTASPELAVVDVSDPRRPRLTGYVRPPLAAHDVGFAPSGRVWVTSGATGSIAVYHGTKAFTLPADAAPQHVTFLRGRAFVTSGNDGILRVYDEASTRLLHTTRIPIGSYNVQFAAGRVLTPSLNAGTLCVLDAAGHLLERTRVAASSHDACLARA